MHYVHIKNTMRQKLLQDGDLLPASSFTLRRVHGPQFGDPRTVRIMSQYS